MFFTIFMHPTVVYNRKVIRDEHSPITTQKYQHAEDFDLFGRLAGRFPAAMIPENLIVYRIHAGSVTNRHKQEMRRTHLRIVAENLSAKDWRNRTRGLRDIGDAVYRSTRSPRRR